MRDDRPTFAKRPSAASPRTLPAAVVVLCLFFLTLFFALPAAADRWQGPGGEPLPFTEEELLGFLREAEVVERRELGEGINRPLRLTLERGGVRARAIFRTVDVERTDRLGNASSRDRHFRDCHVFEVAAYELSRLLGLESVPPAVLRRLDGRDGSVQLWVEGASSEAKRIERGEKPAQPARWWLQKQLMVAFDNLIYNFDRNPGNVLLDERGKLWWVDHTRSFKRVPALPDAGGLSVVEQGFYERLRVLDPERVSERLRPYLEAAEVGALLRRRELILERVEKLRAEHGDEKVFFRLADAGR